MRDDEWDRNENEIKRSREEAKAARLAMKAAIEKHVADPAARTAIEQTICEYVAAIERNAQAIGARNEAL